MTSDVALRPMARSLRGYLPGVLLGQLETGPGGLLLQLFEHRTTDFPVFVPAVAEPLLVWIANGSAQVEERDDDTDWMTVDVDRGDLFVVDSDKPYELRWNARGASFEALHVHIGVPLIEEAAIGLLGHAQRPALREMSGVRDDAISALLEVLRREIMRPGQSSPMLVEALGRALAVCVVRTFRDTGSRLRRRGALPAHRLHAVIRYMRDHMAEPLSLARMAAVTKMSPYHFSRMFQRSTGCSPHRYFVHLRIAEAQRLLRETDKPVIAISMAVGYASPSHFAQIFRRLTGMSPSVFRI